MAALIGQPSFFVPFSLHFYVMLNTKSLQIHNRSATTERQWK
jgi:hypothetical protein